MLDETLFMYVEDVDWSLRIRARRLRRRARARRARAAQGLGVERRRRVDREPLLRHAQHDRRRRAARPLPRGCARCAAAVVVGAHLLLALSHPSRAEAMRAVLAGWRDARAGRLGQRSSR